MAKKTARDDKDEVEFFFDLGSPYSYFASTQLSKFESRNNVKVIWRPILLGGLFKSVENKSPFYVESVSKKQYLLSDLEAWASLYQIPFKLPSQFPPNTLVAMRGALFAQQQGLLNKYAEKMFHAYFVNDFDISDTSVVLNIANEVGMDLAEFSSAVDSAEIKQGLLEATKEAEDRGAFGVPTFFYGNQMFFGNDRFILLEHAISQSA